MWTLASNATVTLSGTPTGTAYIWLDNAGVVNVGSNLTTVACGGGGCTPSSATAIPVSTIPVASWTATSGTWDSGGGSPLLAGYIVQASGGGGGGGTVTDTEQYFWTKDSGGTCYPATGISTVGWGSLSCSTNGGRTSLTIPPAGSGVLTISRFISVTQTGAINLSLMLQNSQGGSGTVIFTIDHYCAANGAGTTSPTYVGSQTLTTTIPTDVAASSLGIKTISLDLTGCVPSNMQWIRLTQVNTGTYPNSLDWFGTTVSYTHN